MAKSPSEHPPDDRISDTKRILHEMSQAVREALADHKLRKNPIAIWRNGRVEWIAPEDIPDEAVTPLPELP